MTKKSKAKLKELVAEIMDVCAKEKVDSLTVGITGDLVSIWNYPYKHKKDRIDLFSNDRGKTWIEFV